jgi:hypothetical protein
MSTKLHRRRGRRRRSSRSFRTIDRRYFLVLLSHILATALTMVDALAPRSGVRRTVAPHLREKRDRWKCPRGPLVAAPVQLEHKRSILAQELGQLA